MSYVSFRTRPKDEKNLKKLCKEFKINRSEALRFAIETAVSVLEKKKKSKLASFIGSFEGPEDLSSNSRSILKQKLLISNERAE